MSEETMSAAEEQVELSLRDELIAASQPDESTETVEATGQETTETEKSEQLRDEKGRFASKAEETAEQVEQTEQQAESTETSSTEEAQQETAQTDDTQASAPPHSWSAESKAKWHELPEEIRQEVAKRELDLHSFTSKRDEHASFGKEMYRAVQPYMAQIQAEGGTPAGAVQSLLNTAYVLRTGSPEQKRDALMQAAKQYGVDLGQPQQQTEQQLPPELQTHVAPLAQKVSQLESQIAQREQAAENQIRNEVQAEIDAFASDPAHPHYGEVKGHMAALINQGAAKDLKEAYEQACWASPTVRATLQAQQRVEEDQKRRKEAQERADKAKAAGVSITGGPGSTAQASAPVDRSLADELRANMAASTGAV